MSNQSKFSQEEWAQLLRAPTQVGLLVALSSPSGPVGAAKESLAITRLIVEAHKLGVENAFVAELVKSWLTPAGHSAGSVQALLGKSPEQLRAESIAAVSASKYVVSEKLGESDANAWADWLNKVAQRVAEAANEGGFFGFGGTQVNEAEKAALAQIAKALL